MRKRNGKAHLKPFPFPAVLRGQHLRRGFTLIEILVVALVLAVLIIWFLPQYYRPRPGLKIRCLNNVRQLNLAWVLYASDSNDKLVTNRAYAVSDPLPLDNWVAGVMDWSTNSQSTNSSLLLTAALSVYLKSPQVYQCPDDRSASAAGPRVRSYSVNGFMGSNTNKPAFAGWRQYRKLTEVQSPTTTFVFIDEHPNSIGDGYFINDPNQTNAWLDLPASAHNGAAGVGFADGHAEIHKWADASTKLPVKPSAPKPVVKTKPGSVTDYEWLLKASTMRETNSTAELPE